MQRETAVGNIDLDGFGDGVTGVSEFFHGGAANVVAVRSCLSLVKNLSDLETVCR